MLNLRKYLDHPSESTFNLLSLEKHRNQLKLPNAFKFILNPRTHSVCLRSKFGMRAINIANITTITGLKFDNHQIRNYFAKNVVVITIIFVDI